MPMTNRPWKIKPKAKVIDLKDDFYSQKQWIEKRKRYLYQYPFCTIGQRLGHFDEAEDLDHIIPRSHGGHPYDERNLQGLTHTRHSVKTKYEMRTKGALYEHENGIPLRQWGKLIPVGKKPIVAIIGPTGAGKSTLLEAMQPDKYFDHIHQIDNSDWSTITHSIWNDPGYHIVECVGAHFAFKKLLADHRLSFFIIRVSITREQSIERRKDKYSETDIINSYDAQAPIPEDLHLSGWNTEINHEYIVNQLFKL